MPELSALEPQAALGPFAMPMSRADRRRWTRHRADRPAAAVLTADGRTCRCLVDDVSPVGARVRLDGPLPRNLEVRLELSSDLFLYGTRAWSEGATMGLDFRLSPRSLRLAGACLGTGAGAGSDRGSSDSLGRHRQP